MTASEVKAAIEADWRAKGVMSKILGELTLSPNQQLGLPLEGNRLALWRGLVAISPCGPLVIMEFGTTVASTTETAQP